jgi:hypothetical protein
MEDYSDLDTSSESEYESDQESALGSDGDIDKNQNLKPEFSEIYNDEYQSAP